MVWYTKIYDWCVAVFEDKNFNNIINVTTLSIAKCSDPISNAYCIKFCLVEVNYFEFEGAH